MLGSLLSLSAEIIVQSHSMLGDENEERVIERNKVSPDACVVRELEFRK